MSVQAPAALTALFRPIAAELALVEAEIARMTATRAAPLQELLDHVGRFTGKRLRPALTLIAGKLCGQVTPVHATVGAIVELIHTATLVHDDILDESTLRRRVETINRRVGNETAVLLGDFIFATCFKEAAALESRFPSRYLAEIVGIVCRGEILQIHHRHDVELTEETYFRIIEDKTAALYAAALRCGAELSGAPAEVSDAASRFGLKLGCAFQIVDDILDLTGDESAVGKSLGTDLDKAKMTLPLLRLRDRVRPADRERVLAAILSRDAGERRSVLPLLGKYDAVASAHATAETLLAEARRELERLPDRPERALLGRAADYVLARDR
ncbi:MAG: polyprenyl synthetase family protein [Planctomycetota bacterium]|jgi:octaprenyl-diphosphate synthase